METMTYPSILTELPGPRSAAIIETDKEYISPSYTRDFPMVVESGNGVFVTDVDGNVFLDFCCGIAVCSTGHCHPQVVQAVRSQAGKLLHMSGTDFYYQVQTELAKKLNEITPGNFPKKVFFTNSGAEAIEAAMKLSRYHTGRTKFIAYFGAFHGRTMGAVSLTGSKVVQKKGFGPLVPGVTHIPYPDPYHSDNPLLWRECLDFLEKNVFEKTVSPEEVAAIFIEPIQGEGGYIVPPADYLDGVQRIARKHGILLVVDEIQSGMGRTGKMFASEHFNLEPDIICLAKGIASGMPLGAIVARSEVMSWPYGSHASTFGGNPVACAAALKTIELLENELVENAASMGEYLQRKLKKLQQKYSFIGDVRGKGLMVGMEIVKDKSSREKNPELRNQIVEKAFYKGLIILGCGTNTMRFAPALIVEKEHIDCCIEIMDEVCMELGG